MKENPFRPKCGFCETVVKEESLSIPILILEGDDQVVELAISQAVWILEDYFLNQFTHLSMSEILWYRPDVVIEAVKKYFPRTTKIYTDCLIVCTECYCDWIEEHPLI